MYQQEPSGTTKSSGKDQSIELVKTWSLDHIKATGTANVTNRFTVSDSGSVGICRGAKPSLSILYPDTDKAPVILSKNIKYSSATFVKFRGKEHLAAACLDDGCLHLWDIESRTYKKVFDPTLPMNKLNKYMNICKIDENTIAYGEEDASPEESRSIFILKTGIDQWTISATLELFTPSNIRDMCYTEVDDGTPCLLLCVPWAQRIMAVEMVQGKTRWEAGKEQMGTKFKPWSICTDGNGCAYVADCGQDKIHLLSASDGMLIKRFDVGSCYGIQNVFTVRFHDQHLYIEWKNQQKNQKVKKYVIMKFKQIKEM